MAIVYKSGKPLPPRADAVKGGKYRLRVLDAEEKQSGKGDDMIALKMEVLGSVDGSLVFDPETNPGPIVFDNLLLTEKCFWKLDQFRAARGEVVVEGQDVAIDSQEFIGDEVEAALAVETKDNRDGKLLDKPRNVVRGYNKAAEATITREDADNVPF